MSQDVVADGINMIMNCKKAKKDSLEIKRYSNLLIEVLKIAKREGYIDYSLDEKNKVLNVKITKLNKCQAIKPRFFVKKNTIEKYVRRYLPSRNFGVIIISTSSGLLTHQEAIEKEIGGSLIAYFY